MKHMIAPSVLAANFANLEKDLKMVNSSEADYLHVDIMDGVFVPNISFGQSIVSTMNAVSTKPLDVHLMIVNPDQYVEDFVNAGAKIISVHYEASPHLHRSLQHIKSFGIQAGVAINPHTPVEHLFDVLENCDIVCLMSVNPGFGGQKFIYRTLEKIKKLKKEITDRNLDCKIEIDGGVGLQNAEKILQAGADILVAGSAVFSNENPQQVISQLKSIDVHTLSY